MSGMSPFFRVMPFTEYRGGETKPRIGLAIECSLRLPEGTTPETAESICEAMDGGVIDAFAAHDVKTPQ